MSVLAKIVASKRAELGALVIPTATPPVARDARAALTRASGEPLRLLTEVKFKSPSAGPLSTVLDAKTRAAAYARAGAAMVSVLCDGPFFGGSWADLAAVRAQFEAEDLAACVLAKEFVIDARQLAMARACGADSVLLIARILPGNALGDLVAAARREGVEPLVEVVDEAEVARALGADARIIGVNARDLDTLVMDRDRAARVLDAIPRDRVALHLSGIKSEADVRAVAEGRADGALIGEVLMREDYPAPLVARFVAAARQ